MVFIAQRTFTGLNYLEDMPLLKLAKLLAVIQKDTKR